MLIRFLTLFALLLTAPLFAQTNLTQTIRGKVTDADTGQPLASATVQIIENQVGTTTDSLGNYRLINVPVGRYRLQASYVGYQTLTITEILVESGREVIQNIELSEQATQVDEVVVRASREMTQPVSVKSLTIEEVLRFPATFYDPARLATAFAGVVGDNDQANGISVRGNSPNGLLWRLEGVDIVNPNHTPNAGTFSDRVTANGGGVNILSAQMLGTSTFYSGAFPAEYGNALSAVMDMRLRTGNDQKHETIAQIGLIGIDVANEGPFSQKGGASYLFNARYSTVGLLGELGLDFGGETINFYDLSFNLNFPFKNGARLTFFGMGGNSENIFKAERDSTVWEFQKDRFDINFRSSMGAIGTTYTQPIGKQAFWRTALAYSILNSERRGERLNDLYRLVNVESDELLQSKLSLHSYLNFKLSARSNWQIGVVATQQNFQIESVENQQLTAFGEGDGVLLQPYTTWRYQLGTALTANIGLHLSHFTFNATTSVEPRASLDWELSEKRNISIAYGLHSQLQQPQLYFALNKLNENVDFTRSHHVVLGYREKLNQSSTLNAEFYYQSLFDVPILQQPGSTFSALNLLETFVNEQLINAGTGRNYGIELSYQKFITDDFYLLSNITLYESKYKGSDGIERDTRWNGNYIFNATAGKEWRWAQKGGNINAVFGLNGRVAYLGGFRDTPIDAEASLDAGETIYFENQAFTIQQKAYFRTDLRFYYKRNKAKYSTTLALDIQNATNAQNVAFSYYDIQKQAVVIKNQLGIIPLLSWRIEF
ncbi:MAG: TonB-dependent receptor [Saprospiraceae bacterium]